MVKNKKLIILSLIATCIVIGIIYSNKAGAHYYKKDGKMMYYCMEFFNECHEGVIEKADPGSFEIIPGKRDYAKDINYVYIEGTVLQGADPKSFEKINEYSYAKDKKNVFAGSEVINDADVHSFEVLSHSYSKDKNNIYYRADKVEKADIESFIIITNKGQQQGFFKDINHIYFNGKVVDNADPISFKVLYNPITYVNWQYHYLADNNNVYYLNEGTLNVLHDADPKTFTPLKGLYAKDSDHVFYNDEILAKADPETFYIFDTPYPCAKDENYVFVRNVIEEGIDPNNFTPW